MLPGNLPLFPSFRSIDTTDSQWYVEFYEKFDPYADFCFANLMTWLNINDDLVIAQLNNNVIFKFTDIFSNNPLEPSISILGSSLANETIQKLIGNAPSTYMLTMLPECLMHEIDLDFISITENRDNWDYVYHIPTFLSLGGPEYKRLRYQINSFKKSYEKNIKTTFTKLTGGQEGKELISLLRNWKSAYQFGNDPEEVENIALQRRLISLNGAGCHVLRLYINNKIEGFLITTILPNKGYAIIHHIKCSYKFNYLFDYLFYSALGLLADHGLTHVNLEQDLGIEGLRQHKLLLRPSAFLKKYSVNWVR